MLVTQECYDYNTNINVVIQCIYRHTFININIFSQVNFEFRSALYTKLAQVFFDELVHRNVAAFLKRAAKIYGKPTPIPENKVVIKHSLSS